MTGAHHNDVESLAVLQHGLVCSRENPGEREYTRAARGVKGLVTGGDRPNASGLASSPRFS
jgi:hypothetical protein